MARVRPLLCRLLAMRLLPLRLRHPSSVGGNQCGYIPSVICQHLGQLMQIGWRQFWQIALKIDDPVMPAFRSMWHNASYTLSEPEGRSGVVITALPPAASMAGHLCYLLLPEQGNRLSLPVPNPYNHRFAGNICHWLVWQSGCFHTPE